MGEDKTSVEFLIQEWTHLINEYDMNRLTNHQYLYKLDLIQDKAKEMAKDEIELSFRIGYSNGQVESGKTSGEYFKNKYNI